MKASQKVIFGVAILAGVSMVKFLGTDNQKNEPEEAPVVLKSSPSPSPKNTSNAQVSSTNKKVRNQTAMAEQEELLQQPDSNPNFETFGERYENLTQRRAGAQLDAQAIYSAMQQPNAWESTDSSTSPFNLSDAQINDGRTFINLSSMKIESLAPGDTLDIQVENYDIDFTATIDEVRSDDGGKTLTWYGSSAEGNSSQSITLTKGDTLVVGGIFTDDGLYQLEVKEGKGYIVNNATLFQHGQDQVVQVPEHMLENPPEEYILLESETFDH